MKNMIRLSLLVLGVSAFASMGAFAATSATVSLSANVGTVESLSCTTSSVFFGELTAGGTSNAQTVVCTVTDNDDGGTDMTMYITRDSLVGTLNSGNYIPTANISYSLTNALESFTSFVPLNGSYSGSDGAAGFRNIAQDAVNADANFYLKLAVPEGQAADHYAGTLNIVITPHEV
jgi:hypothetical protein